MRQGLVIQEGRQLEAIQEMVRVHRHLVILGPEETRHLPGEGPFIVTGL
jgi:hypothetical protein